MIVLRRALGLDVIDCVMGWSLLLLEVWMQRVTHVAFRSVLRIRQVAARAQG